MTLHPADAKIVLESGWGERHPLARGGWCRRFVPREFVLIYAPRNEKEIEVVIRIVAASIWWVAGIDVTNSAVSRKVSGPNVEGLLKEQIDNECHTCRLHSCGGEGLGKITGEG